MNTGDAVLLNRYHVERRFYGFANNLLDTFGYGVGIATGLAAFIAFMRKKYQMLILIPGFLVLAFFNARTGIFIGILGVIIVLGWMVITGSKKLKLIAVAVAIAIALMTPLSLNFLKAKQPVTYYWLYHDFYSIMIKFFGDNGKTIVKDNTANNLFSDRFWFLPSGKELVFGSGHSIYQVPGYKHSDVGYVNDIWLLGGIGFAFLSSIVIFIFSKIAMMDKRMISIVIFMILALLIFQIKARAIMANSGFVISLMIVASSYLPAPARSQEKYHW
ncbi:MAG: hypothetical protein Q3996_00285 [Candidatus Saccharibacteria bacterium]|nr:hypothetical protein [Candidatus Saccharibacteria bacterium]